MYYFFAATIFYHNVLEHWGILTALFVSLFLNNRLVKLILDYISVALYTLRN